MDDSASHRPKFYSSRTTTPDDQVSVSTNVRGKSSASSESTPAKSTNSPTGPRFQCPKCAKNFSRIENLTRHQANHDDIGKFVCPVCRKRFTRSDLLNRHRKIHPKESASSDIGVSKSHVTQVQFASGPPLRGLDRVARQETRASSVPHESSPSEASTFRLQAQPNPPAVRQHVRPPNPVLVAFQNALPQTQFPPNRPSILQSQGLGNLMEAALAPPAPIVSQKNPASNLWDNGLFMGLGNGNSDSYMGSYDADISWALDSFNAESISNYSSDYEMMNTFEVPTSQFQFVQYPPHQPSNPPENPIDAADNEDEDTNDWPDKVDKPTAAPRRAPRIVPLRLIPVSWQPLLDETRSARLNPSNSPNLQHISMNLRQSLIESLNGDRRDDSTPEISDSMFPPPEALDFFLRLYFQHIQPRFPILHLPAFNLYSSPPLLLVAMMLLGSSHSTSDRGRFSRIFHGPLRIACLRIHSLDSKYLRSLDNILTYFLLCLAGTWSGSKESYEFAEGARGVLVTACRRMRLLDCRPAPLDIRRFQDSGFRMPEANWLAWAEAEKGKRLGLSVYMYDCQYPGLFNNQHFVSKAETTNLCFPCDEALWEARTVETWRALLGPQELPKSEYWLRALNCCLLHRYIIPAPPVIKTGEFGKTLLLYAIHTHIFDWRQATCMLAPTGLMGITAPWDMGNPLRERRIWLLDALDSWAECYQDSDTSTAACLLHRLGYIALDLNLSDMHLVAGRSNNLNDGNFAEQNLKHWANSENATSTMGHIYTMLQICHHRVENGLAAEASYEIAVCLFTGGIVCWAFAKLKGELGLEREKCVEEVRRASKALKVMGCWRMGAMFGRILNAFEMKIGS